LNEGDHLAAVANVPADEDEELDKLEGSDKPKTPPEPKQKTIFEN
jgi:hypothetical protein